MKVILDPADEAEWLAMRQQDVTSTECSALFGLSPYLTEYELWHQKASGERGSFFETERMTWGKRLEPIIAEGVAEDQGWSVEPFKLYIRDDEARLGSSFDYRIINHQEGDGILEIKNVDRSAFAKKWVEYANGTIEAPEHIELQVQHQMEVADMEYAVIAALVGGNELKMSHRTRDRAVGKAIRAKVAEFWDSIDKGVPPKPDYDRDYDRIVRANLAAVSDEVMEADEALDLLIADYRDVAALRKDIEAKEKVLKAQIIERAGTASKIHSGHGTVSCGATQPSPGKLITADMVGTYTGARAPFRVFRFTARKD